MTSAPHSTTARQLALIDQLRDRPFPAHRGLAATAGGVPGEPVRSGPGGHVAQLWEGPPLWDADPADAEAIREECAAGLAALTAVLSLRWGPPTVVELAGRLERLAWGLPVRPPLDLLCGQVARVHTWQAGGRWVAIGAGQGGPELPYRLLAAIGEGTVEEVP
ncbi:hypothetical protein [Streptomyces celluloflavus]|uniref:hypothetical protein n=1 Tax=Streptomyces celluloflavus TaxID=58344 RepID=UPI0036AD1063